MTEYVYLVVARHPDVHGCVPMRVCATMSLGLRIAKRLRDEDHADDGTVYEVEKYSVMEDW